MEAAGLWVFFREPYFCAVLPLTLNTAAYTAYILRGAVQNVPFGEVEHMLSGHLRERASERDQIATEALAVR